MTVADAHLPAQRFLFPRVDWAYYEETLRRLEGQRVFVTYYKGRLEIVTVSYIHDRTSRLLYSLIKTLAEETRTPIVSAGMTTLKRRLADAGVEADESFYIANHKSVLSKKEIDLDVDPPPDLALEVEVTRRLGQRTEIYRELGVPEVWRYASGGLVILVRKDEQYEQARRSPTFPVLSPQEITGFIESGLNMDETTWVGQLRERIREALASSPSRSA